MKKVGSQDYCMAAEHFDLAGKPVSFHYNNSGHINDTVIVQTEEGGKTRRYILQRINTDIFLKPDELMENIVHVTGFLKEKILAGGGDPKRETLTVIMTKDGAPLYRDAQGNCWRMYEFIEDTVCYDKPDLPERFGQSGYIFGKFQQMLSDYPAGTLHETIPDFHNTGVRYQAFLRAIEENPAGRAGLVQEEIHFLTDRHDYAEMLKGTAMPLRVVHNDAKLSNVLFDRSTGKALCVIDLDTIMPGYTVMDFGDAIRFGASTASEDEPDLTKVHFDRHLYELFHRKFLAEAGDALTEEEVRMLPEGAKLITYEQALRFLGDYLAGDVYYHTERPEQNLDRARTQIRLLEEMEREI